MRDSHIGAEEFLTATDDEGRRAEARRLFEASGKPSGADGYEIWDGSRFIYRFPGKPLQL